MKPDSIRKFDIFFLASVAMSVASSLLNFDTQVEALKVAWEPQGLQDYAGTFVFVTLAVAFAVNMLLWYLASRFRQGWVKWVLIFFIAYTLITTVAALNMGVGSVSITGAITILLKIVAVYFLFQTDAKEWFASKGE